MPQYFNYKIALLHNVVAFDSLVVRIMNRSTGLPGMAVMHGHSGSGKSFAAAFAALRYGACHIQANAHWTRNFFLEVLVGELGLDSQKKARGKHNADKFAEICAYLAKSQRILIVDGADRLIGKGMVETIKDICAASRSPIILVGRDCLPTMLRRRRQVLKYILEQIRVEACDLDDCAALAEIYCREFEPSRERLMELHKKTNGCARSIAMHLSRLRPMYECRPSANHREDQPPHIMKSLPKYGSIHPA